MIHSSCSPVSESLSTEPTWYCLSITFRGQRKHRPERETVLGAPNMEGVGSRLGRASSRYGPSTAVFSGPVRKWKKKWVHVSQSRVSYHSSHSQSNGSSRLLLCRWTPISPSTVSDTTSAGSADEAPRRKFRYTPVYIQSKYMYSFVI